jgi:hypothetical protein
MMISRLCASWLIVLIMLPFTAPFSTCDLSILAGRAPGHHEPFMPRTWPRRALNSTNSAPSVVPSSATSRMQVRRLERSPRLGSVPDLRANNSPHRPLVTSTPLDPPPAFAAILRV